MMGFGKVGRLVFVLLLVARLGGCADASGKAKDSEGLDNHYASLGMEQESKRQDIKTSYHSLSLKCVYIRTYLFTAHARIWRGRQPRSAPERAFCAPVFNCGALNCVGIIRTKIKGTSMRRQCLSKRSRPTR